MHVYIQDLANHVGEEVTIKGWLYNRTNKGKLRFLLVRDGSGFVQSVVFKNNVSDAAFRAADSVTQESSLKIS